YPGDTLVFQSTKALDETEATAYVRRRLGQDALARVSLREGTVPLMRNGRPPKLPKADDELTRELRRLIGPEQHQAELYLGHPTEELSELLLDMSFLSQEALEDSEISAIIESLRQEHEHDAQYRDLHSRYLTHHDLQRGRHRHPQQRPHDPEQFAADYQGQDGQQRGQPHRTTHHARDNKVRFSLLDRGVPRNHEENLHRRLEQRQEDRRNGAQRGTNHRHELGDAGHDPQQHRIRQPDQRRQQPRGQADDKPQEQLSAEPAAELRPDLIEDFLDFGPLPSREERRES